MIPVTTAIDDAGEGACSTSGATVGAPGNYTISADATEKFTENLNAFRRADRGTFTLVSRSDGIDLPADTCRVMVLDGVPTGTSLLEQFLYERLEMQAAQDRRIADRITQLFGRINRGRNDYGVFLIEGNALGVWLARDRSVALLPPLLRQQVLVGRMVQEEVEIRGPDRAIEAANAILDRNESWIKFYGREVRNADLADGALERATEVENDLIKAALAEAKYVEAVWKRDFQRARHELETVNQATVLADTRLGGWHEVWIAATHDAEQDEGAANEHYAIASAYLSDYLRLPRRQATVKGLAERGDDTGSFTRTLLDFTEPPSSAAFQARTRQVKSELAWIEDSSTRRAEAGVRRLGEVMGFHATPRDPTTTAVQVRTSYGKTRTTIASWASS